MTIFSVLTGDLVNSSALSAGQVDTAFRALDSAVRTIQAWAPRMRTGFGRRGGDAWQFAISDQRLDIRSSLMFRAALRREGKAFATRIALARGPGTLPASRDPNAASGAAFTASGRLLSTLSGPHLTMAHADGDGLHALVLLADHISQRWTPAQAAAMFEMLSPDPGTHAAAADRLGISRQAVDQALAAAGFHALSAALAAIESDAGPQP